MPLYGANVWLHAITVAAAAYFGWFHRVDMHDLVADRTGNLVGRH